jgi:hypothetical protein
VSNNRVSYLKLWEKACELKHGANFRRAGQLHLVHDLQFLSTDRDTNELEGILNLPTKYAIANK